MSTLDCQDCGEILRVLTFHEQQQISERPYDFIAYCRQCAGDAMEKQFRVEPTNRPDPWGDES